METDQEFLSIFPISQDIFVVISQTIKEVCITAEI